MTQTRAPKQVCLSNVETSSKWRGSQSAKGFIDKRIQLDIKQGGRILTTGLWNTDQSDSETRCTDIITVQEDLLRYLEANFVPNKLYGRRAMPYTSILHHAPHSKFQFNVNQKLQATYIKSHTNTMQVSVHSAVHPRIITSSRICHLITLAFLACPGLNRLWGQRQQQIRGEGGDQRL